jgi:thiol-disulfide isomerase/thioredoxin
MRKRFFLPTVLLVLAGQAGAGADPKNPNPSDDLRTKLPGLKEEQLADPAEATKAADLLEKAYAGTKAPESVRMLVAILRGSQMGPQDGWFGPAESRYDWKWLAAHCGLPAAAKEIPKDKFRGPEACFKRLDRDGDGRITPGDLDWSDRNPWVQQARMVNGIFRRLNARGDGKVSRADLDEFYKRVAGGKEFFTPDDLRSALIQGGSGFAPGDGPDRAVLIRGLFAGEIGSMNEGPRVGDTAPDFTLKTPSGGEQVQLSKLTGTKPVVLLLGNFTCGPFRATYPEVDALYQRYKDQANFLMVYVREAHPTDGWKMASNAKSGVEVKQPATFAERTKVCDQFCERLKPSMPVVVDEINDPVGHAYSGMPARLYIIDAKGKVAYKAGRGPFGLKPGETEQALLMALLEQGTDR